MLFLILMSQTVFADSINFGVWTDHTMPGEFVEQNNLVALEINDYVAVKFTNSYDYESYIAGKIFHVVADIGFLVGLSHGYNRDCVFKTICDPSQLQLNPFAALHIEKNIGRLKIRFIEAYLYRTMTIGFNFK